MKSLIYVLLISAVMQAGDGSVLSSDGGRYVFGQISGFRLDHFMLDTKTGQLWICLGDSSQGSMRILEPVNYNYYQQIGGSVLRYTCLKPDSIR